MWIQDETFGKQRKNLKQYKWLDDPEHYALNEQIKTFRITLLKYKC
jgi:hypothetical protein